MPGFELSGDVTIWVAKDKEMVGRYIYCGLRMDAGDNKCFSGIQKSSLGGRKELLADKEYGYGESAGLRIDQACIDEHAAHNQGERPFETSTREKSEREGNELHKTID